MRGGVVTAEIYLALGRSHNSSTITTRTFWIRIRSGVGTARTIAAAAAERVDGRSTGD